MSHKKYRKPKAARNRTIAQKRVQQLKQAQERKRRMRFSRRRKMIDAAKRRKKAVKYYRALKQKLALLRGFHLQVIIFTLSPKSTLKPWTTKNFLMTW